jgi:hypothetical protein
MVLERMGSWGEDGFFQPEVSPLPLRWRLRALRDPLLGSSAATEKPEVADVREYQGAGVGHGPHWWDCGRSSNVEVLPFRMSDRNV